MTQNDGDILKNAILDSTEAYLEARLAVADFVKTQIGVISACTYNQSDKKYYHTVKCDNGRVTYNNVLSIGNNAFPEDSVVFLIVPNAQFSNQFILGKLDNTPINISGGSIDIGNGNFVVTSEGVMTAKQGTFEGTITGGSININDKFIVDAQGNMEATTGTIGNFTLDDGSIYAWGVINFRTNNVASAPSQNSYWKELSSFTPSTLGILSDFQVIFNYEVLTSSSRPMYIQLQRYDEYNDSWDTIQTVTLNNTAGMEDEITFNTTFSNTNTNTYRLFFTINSTSSSTYQQSIRYSIYTNRVISTALTINGYNGKINSASGVLGGIEYGTGRLSSLNNGYYNGFEIDNDSLEIRNNADEIVSDFGNTYFMYSKSYAWAQGAEYPVMGLFVRTDSSSPSTTLTLYKDSDNRLDLDHNGYFHYYINGTGHAGYLGGGSDKRIKEDINPLDIEMSKELINKTNTYKFKYKNNDGYHYGVIAQEARKLLDDLDEKDARLEYSVGDTNIKDQRNVNYLEYIPPLINVVKNLQRQINNLKKEDK